LTELRLQCAVPPLNHLLGPVKVLLADLEALFAVLTAQLLCLLQSKVSPAAEMQEVLPNGLALFSGALF
jgi:hypothetical protein